MARNCNIPPAGAEGFAGVTVIEESVAAVIDSVVVLDTPPDAAVMVVLCPAVTAVARPEALMVAAAVFEDDHVTVDVRSLVLLSE